jgi:hypothetical protein
VWKEAPESTTQSMGKGDVRKVAGCAERARGGAPTWLLGGEGDNEGSIAKEAITARGKTRGPAT